MRVEDSREVGRKVFEETPRRVEEEEVVEENLGEEEVVMEKAQKTTVEVEMPPPMQLWSFNLLQVFTELDDHFLKASDSAQEVSKMLEATRLHYHSNFADNRGHIDHSARVMRVITWNRSFRGLNLDNADNANDDFDSEENETHATVLDKMLAWGKKLMMK
ncbi:hypothetical protein GQ457_01G038060 [Hibiscus cannabinus]